MKRIMIAAVLIGLNLSANATQTIRFATEASYPPFEFIGSDNHIQGFDIDVANALCKEMAAECIFTNQAFDSLIPGVKFRRFDAVIAGMDITPEREKQVLFTRPYYDNAAAFIIRKGTIASIEALQGKRVGVQNGTTHQKYLTEKQPGISSVAYDSYQNAVLDLKNGRIDAVFGDTAVINEWLKQNTNLSTLGAKVTDNAYFGRGLGIALRHNNQDLQAKFNTALEKIKADGKYTIIYQKWFQQPL